MSFAAPGAGKPATVSRSLSEELRTLAELREASHLSEPEFAAAKQAVLQQAAMQQVAPSPETDAVIVGVPLMPSSGTPSFISADYCSIMFAVRQYEQTHGFTAETRSLLEVVISRLHELQNLDMTRVLVARAFSYQQP